MDGRTYYFDKGDLKDNYGSTKYYEIRRCKKDEQRRPGDTD